MTELVATSRDRLADALFPYVYSKHSAARVVDVLIDSGVVRVVDPTDPELFERVKAAIRPTLRFLDGTHPSRDLAALDATRSALRAVFPA